MSTMIDVCGSLEKIKVSCIENKWVSTVSLLRRNHSAFTLGSLIQLVVG